jgi:orotate phosphoribosyltransferase
MDGNVMDPLGQLRQLLIDRSVQRGDFVLSSGNHSSYYIDARRTTMSGPGLRWIGELGLQLLEQQRWQPRAVGGLTLGADPVAYALAHAAALRGQILDAFTVRKEPKSHGSGRLIEGLLEPGWEVVVIEDTITTGASALRALETVRDAGAVVLGVLALVDREEGGATRIGQAGVQVASLFKVSELL